jgi:prepilin-type N-terminal cleavage/methylation domain-containing protein
MRIASDRRLGFTLVEVLIVIAIIGMLASLSTVAVRRVMRTVRQSQINTEMNGLTTALNAYKEQAREFPPCFADTDQAGEDVNTRKKRFVDHLKFAFPRYTPFSPNGTAAADLYLSIQTEIANNYQVRPNNASQAQPLNLDNLVLNQNEHSPAEALVFWLAGFPMPDDPTDNKPMGTQPFCGFNADVMNPFRFQESIDPNADGAKRRELWLSKRTQSKFSFDVARLVDLDGDGWLEYVPEIGENMDKSERRPYVYFDARCYSRPGAGAYALGGGTPTNSPGYRPYVHPRTSGNSTDSVAPYARGLVAGEVAPNFAVGASVQWMNDQTFQIICAGLDNQFSPLEQERAFTALQNNSTLTSPYVAGGYLLDPSGTRKNLSVEESDNQANFTTELIGSYVTK